MVEPDPVQRDILAGERIQLDGAGAHSEHALVAEHDSLGGPGAAGGEHQQGEIVRPAVVRDGLGAIRTKVLDDGYPRGRNVERRQRCGQGRCTFAAREHDRSVERVPRLPKPVKGARWLLEGRRDRQWSGHQTAE